MNNLEGATQPKASKMDTGRNVQIGLGVALVVVVLGMYGWKAAEVGAIEEKLAAAETAHGQVKTQLIEQARQLDARRAEEDLRRFSTPFSWAIRREVMAANLDQVDQYFVDLVQLQGFQSAVLANPEGKIMVASDRKRLKTEFSSLYPAQYLHASAIKVERAVDGKLRAIIPILGLNQHLGTVVLEYTQPAYTLK
jgi:hypothetical protein